MSYLVILLCLSQLLNHCSLKSLVLAFAHVIVESPDLGVWC